MALLPKWNFIRIYVGVVIMGSFVLLKSYGGNLTASLTVPKVTIPIDSMEDLVSQNAIPWKISKDSFMHKKFKVLKCCFIPLNLAYCKHTKIVKSFI